MKNGLYLSIAHFFCRYDFLLVNESTGQRVNKFFWGMLSKYGGGGC